MCLLSNRLQKTAPFNVPVFPGAGRFISLPKTRFLSPWGQMEGHGLIPRPSTLVRMDSIRKAITGFLFVRSAERAALVLERIPMLADGLPRTANDPNGH